MGHWMDTRPELVNYHACSFVMSVWRTPLRFWLVGKRSWAEGVQTYNQLLSGPIIRVFHFHSPGSCLSLLSDIEQNSTTFCVFSNCGNWRSGRKWLDQGCTMTCLARDKYSSDMQMMCVWYTTSHPGPMRCPFSIQVSAPREGRWDHPSRAPVSSCLLWGDDSPIPCLQMLPAGEHDAFKQMGQTSTDLTDWIQSSV